MDFLKTKRECPLTNLGVVNMGIDYIPKNKYCDSMNPNYSGADVIGMIGKEIGFFHYDPCVKDSNRIPYSANMNECLDAVIRINRALTTKGIDPFYDQWVEAVKNGWWIDNYSAFVEHVKWWRDWFDRCEGYETL